MHAEHDLAHDAVIRVVHYLESSSPMTACGYIAKRSITLLYQNRNSFVIHVRVSIIYSDAVHGQTSDVHLRRQFGNAKPFTTSQPRQWAAFVRYPRAPHYDTLLLPWPSLCSNAYVHISGSTTALSLASMISSLFESTKHFIASQLQSNAVAEGNTLPGEVCLTHPFPQSSPIQSMPVSRLTECAPRQTMRRHLAPTTPNNYTPPPPPPVLPPLCSQGHFTRHNQAPPPPLDHA
jgi:hypothetical protein